MSQLALTAHSQDGDLHFRYSQVVFSQQRQPRWMKTSVKVSSRPDSSSWQVAPPATGHWRRRRLLAPARAPSPPRQAGCHAGWPLTLHPTLPCSLPSGAGLTCAKTLLMHSLTLVHAGMLVWRRRLDGSTAAPLPMHCNAVQETIAIICIV